MIVPVYRCALRCLPRLGGRSFSTSAMEVAFRGVRKVLCVAEKNDAAKGIADLLSQGRMRRVRGRVSYPLCLARCAERDFVVGAGESDDNDLSHLGSSLSPPDHCGGLLSPLRTDGILKRKGGSLVGFETGDVPCLRPWLPHLSGPQNHPGQWLLCGPGVTLG